MNDAPTTEPIAKGMGYSDRCRFCNEFYDKAKPWICPGCWEVVKAVVAENPDEFFHLIQDEIRILAMELAQKIEKQQDDCEYRNVPTERLVELLEDFLKAHQMKR